MGNSTQIVAKTEVACNRIRILVEQVMYEDEVEGIVTYQQEQRDKVRSIVNKIQESHKGKGHYLSELLRMPRGTAWGAYA